MNRKDLRSVSGFLLVFFGGTFILSTIGVLIRVLLGHDVREGFSDNDGVYYLWIYQASFFIALLSGIIFRISGGKFSNISLSGYDSDSDDED